MEDLSDPAELLAATDKLFWIRFHKGGTYGSFDGHTPEQTDRVRMVCPASGRAHMTGFMSPQDCDRYLAGLQDACRMLGAALVPLED